MLASYRKSESPNPFPVTNLQAKVELMYLVHMRRIYRDKSRRKQSRAPEMTASL